MSSTNKTPYYELPQFVGTDIPTWLGDFNGAMSDIDTALKTNADRADLASTQAGQAVQTANAANDAVSALQTTVAGLGDRVAACEATDTAQSSQISQNAGNISNLDGRVTALEQSGGGGNTAVNQFLIGSYNGTASGLTANTDLGYFATTGIPDDKVIGVLVEITMGNASDRFLYRDQTALINRITGTLTLMKRVINSGTATRHTINIAINPESNGHRTVGHISSIKETFSGNTVTVGYNTDGASDVGTDTVDLKIYALYVTNE